MELISHREDNIWIFKLDATETAQLQINSTPVGELYTVGTDRECILTIDMKETDAPPPPEP